MDYDPSTTAEVGLAVQGALIGEAVAPSSGLLGSARALGVEARVATSFSPGWQVGFLVGYERRTFVGTPYYASSTDTAIGNGLRVGLSYEVRQAPSAERWVSHGLRVAPYVAVTSIVENGVHFRTTVLVWVDVLYAPSLVVGRNTRLFAEVGLGVAKGTDSETEAGIRLTGALGLGWGI